MKRFFTIILLSAVCSVAVKAQSFRLIAEAGLNATTFGPNNSSTSSSLSTSANYSSKLGFHFGVSSEFNFGNFSVDPGLRFSQIGVKASSTYSTTSLGNTTNSSTDITGNINYLEIPVNVLYHVKLSEGNFFFVGGGPYLGLGLSGTTETDEITYYPIGGGQQQMEEYTGSNSSTFGSNPTDYRRVVFGVNALAGFTLAKDFRLSVGYDYNLTGPYNSTSPKITDRTFKFTFGWAFL